MLTKSEYLRSLKIVSFTKKKALMLFLLTLFLALLSHIAFFLYANWIFKRASSSVASDIIAFFKLYTVDKSTRDQDDIILDVMYTPNFKTQSFGDRDMALQKQAKFDEVVPQIRPINTNLYEIRFVNKKDLLKNQ